MVKKPRSRKFDAIESASLKLALLKENYQYKDFFEKNRDRILIAYREWRSAVLEGRAPKIPSVNRFGDEISREDEPSAPADCYALLIECSSFDLNALDPLAWIDECMRCFCGNV